MTNIFGLHIEPKDGEYLTKIKYYYTKYKCKAFQIFLSGNPIKIARVTKETINYFNQIKIYVKIHKLLLIIHSPYTINIAEPLDVIHNWWIDSILKEYHISTQIGIKYMILHCGRLSSIQKLYKNNSEEENIQIGIKIMRECLRRICNKINENYTTIKTFILLENTAGQKNELLYNFYDFLKFYKELDKKEKKLIKICLDTCHLFASGSYKLTDAQNVDDLFKLIHKEINISSLKLLHLNDSKYEFGSRVDRHEELLKGTINKSVIIRFIKIGKHYNIPMILETPNPSPIKEIKLVSDTQSF